MRQHHVTHCLLAFALVTLAAAPAIAGPPLVCHPYDIGNAASLPWDAQGTPGRACAPATQSNV